MDSSGRKELANTARSKSTPTRLSGPNQAACGAEISLLQCSFSAARPSSYGNKRLWQKLHTTPWFKGSEMNKEAHIAFCRSAPHWEAPTGNGNSLPRPNLATPSSAAALGRSPFGQGSESLHSTTGPQESSGEASSTERSLPQITTKSNKYYLISWKTSCKNP